MTDTIDASKMAAKEGTTASQAETWEAQAGFLIHKAQQYVPVTLASGRLRQEGCKLKADLGGTARPHPKDLSRVAHTCGLSYSGAEMKGSRHSKNLSLKKKNGS